MSKRKVLIISLDGGDWRFLEWANQYQKMNNIFGFKSRVVLNSTVPAITPAAWASFQTGLNPGQTGIYDFSYWNVKDKEKRVISSNRLPETLWQKLSKKEKRVGLVNLPLTYPPKEIRGTVISGILTPSMDSDFTYPKSLKEKMLEKVPGYHIFNLVHIKEGSPHKNTKGFLDSMAEVAENRYQACKYLLENNSYDLFMAHFQANDVVSHVMWGYLDPEHELFDKKKAGLVAEVFYSKIDQIVGQLTTDFKRTQKVIDPLVLLVSDHGFESHQKRINLGLWLAQEGYTKLNSQFFAKGSLRFKLAKKIGLASRDQARNYFLWQSSQAFATGRSGEGFIYLLNEKVKDELRTKLENLVDPETGKKVIKKVWSKEELYSGDKLADMPDIIIEPTSGYSCSSTPKSKNLPIFEPVEKEKDFHLGKHRKEGILASSLGLNRKSYSILDIAPTISYYLTSSKEGKFDGEVIEEINK